MPSSLSSLWNPTRTTPPPVAINLARVMVAGTGAWALALAVTLVLAVAGRIEWDAAWVCATGAVLGLLGVGWARRHPDPTTADTTADRTPTDPGPRA